MKYIKTFNESSESINFTKKHMMWNHANRWGEELSKIIGFNEEGEEVNKQDIDSILNNVDMGKYTREEWKEFFDIIIEEGI